MADTVEYSTGAIWGVTNPTLPDWQRTYYEEMLLETIRMKSILVPYARKKVDFAAKAARSMTFTEVYDLEPKWNTTTEDSIWFKGGSLDSRTVSLGLEMYHDVIKWGDYTPMFTFFTPGFDEIVRTRVGQQITDVLDILMRNALLEHPYPSYAGTASSRATLAAADIFDPDIAEHIRAHLEDHDVPGVVSTEDGGPVLLCVTSSRVIHDIRTGNTAWLDVQNYNSTGRKFNAEVGSWAGTRFIKTNRLRLRNAGTPTVQTQLSAAIVPGQGSAATVDTVYKPGQTGSTRYISVDSVTNFAVGMNITVHDGTLGTAVLDSDGSQEVRRVISIDVGNNRLSVDKPFLKDHAIDDYVTNGLDVHASVFLGGPSVVWGIAEAPWIYPLPKFDDANYVNRLGWRGMMKFQQFRPEFYEVHYSAGSADPIAGP